MKKFRQRKLIIGGRTARGEKDILFFDQKETFDF